MSEKLEIVSVVGARPQFVKLAPIARTLGAYGDVRHSIIHTGQHYDRNMSGRFFSDLELPFPDVDLSVGSGSHADQTGAMLTGLDRAFENRRPDVVLVYGDTNSTLAATLVASKVHIPVAHIEAGLRSFDRAMPEEVNRLVADHCSDRLYAPTPKAMENLSAENLGSRAIQTGDVMLDAIQFNVGLSESSSNILDSLKLENSSYGVVTVHRPVNTSGSSLNALMCELEKTTRQYSPLIFPVHPRTRHALDRLAYRPPEGLILLEPLPYLDIIQLIRFAAVVITDSGGVQKEAAFLNTPCLTMRSETEWPETVEIGVNRLIGNAASGLATAIESAWNSEDMFNGEVLQALERHYGQGDAAQRIVKDCIEWTTKARR